MNTKNQLFIKKIKINKENFPSLDIYPYNIEIIKNFKELNLTTPVTFLIGDNGTGKSTLIESLAIACKINPEGGTQNFCFSTKNTHTDLYRYLQIEKLGIPETKFFLRAESFYNVATEIVRLKEEDHFNNLYTYYGGNPHECSHGESFINLIQNRFTKNGLYRSCLIPIKTINSFIFNTRSSEKR